MTEQNLNFSYEEFVSIINNLEKEGIPYFVFGGFAYDGINQTKISHYDLDIAFFKKDVIKIIKLFKKLGFETYKRGKKQEYRKGNNKIDVIFIIDKGDYFEVGGNMCIDHISKEAFKDINKLNIGDIKFNPMPNEWFSLYFGKHFKPEKLEATNIALSKIMDNCKKLKILEQINIEKPKNMELIKL